MGGENHLEYQTPEGTCCTRGAFEGVEEYRDGDGLGPEQAEVLLKSAQYPDREVFSELATALKRAGERATEQESAFNRRDFTRYLAEEGQGRGLHFDTLRSARDKHLAESPDIVRLGRHKGEYLYTTREMMEQEMNTRRYAARTVPARSLHFRPKNDNPRLGPCLDLK